MGCPLNDFITIEGDPEEGERILSRLRGVRLRPAPPEKTAFRGISAGIFKQFMGARNQVGIGLYRTGAAGYIGWRNEFLGIGSCAP